MFEVYLIIATIEIAFSAFGFSYVILKMIKVKSKCYLQLSESLTTLSIGIFYLVGFILLKRNTNGLMYNVANTSSTSQNLSINSKDVHLAESNWLSNAEARYNNAQDISMETFFDTDRYANDITKLSQIANISKIKIARGLESFNSSNQMLDLVEVSYPEITEDSNCVLHENTLEHLLLVYSFVSGIMALINATYDCKHLQDNSENGDVNDSEKDKDGIRINVKPKESESFDRRVEMFEDSDEISHTTGTSKDDTDNAIRKSSKAELKNGNIRSGTRFVILLILLSWSLPALIASSICMFTNCVIDKTHNFNEHFSDILKPLNVSNTNMTHVNNVIAKIYNIMNNASRTNDIQQNNYSPMMNEIVTNLNNNNNNKRYSKMINVHMHDINFKMHTFIVFIIMNFVTISYVNYECAKMRKCIYSKKLKLFIYLFVINWSPAVFDTFTRVYIYDTKPQLLSNILLAIGNGQKLLSNFIKLKDINKTNYVSANK